MTDATPKENEPRASSDAVLYAALGYIPLLFFLPLWVGSREPFARFHGRQSLVMLAFVVAYQIVTGIIDLVLGRILGNMFILGFFFKAAAWVVHYPGGLLVALAYAVLVVIGIVQAATGEYWRIPVLGVYAERLKL